MRVKNQQDIHVRWMIRRDLPEVLAIERASYARPWSEEKFLYKLRHRCTIGMVVERYSDRLLADVPILGFMIYKLHKRSLRLINLTVHPDHRRKGIGAGMVEKLVNKLSHDRRTTISGRVREGTRIGHEFLHSQGFLPDSDHATLMREIPSAVIWDYVLENDLTGTWLKCRPKLVF